MWKEAVVSGLAVLIKCVVPWEVTEVAKYPIEGVEEIIKSVVLTTLVLVSDDWGENIEEYVGLLLDLVEVEFPAEVEVAFFERTSASLSLLSLKMLLYRSTVLRLLLEVLLEALSSGIKR